MHPRFCFAGATLLAALSTSACSSTPHFDRHFGDSVRASMAAQVINPDAVRNADPVAGIDGRAAKGAQDRYELSVEPPPAPQRMLGNGR